MPNTAIVVQSSTATVELAGVVEVHIGFSIAFCKSGNKRRIRKRPPEAEERRMARADRH